MASANIKKNLGTPQVEVFIGGSGGPYDGRVAVSLYNKNGKSIDLIRGVEYAKGNMHVPLCPNDLAAGIASLDGMIITWGIDVLSFTGEENEQYFVTVTVTQDGDPVDGGKSEQPGALKGGAKFVDGEMEVSVS